MSWIKELDIGDALNEVIKNQRTGNDFILDPLRFEDFKKPEIKKLFIEEVSTEVAAYNAQKLLFIDYPKSNFILRPCARPLLKDLVVYQGIVKYIGSKLYRKIPKDISYSFNKFKDRFSKDKKRHIDHWLAFEERIIQLCKSYDYLLTSDIASFFEHICHDVLKERLLLLNTSDSYSNAVNFLINKLLSKWSQTDNIRNFSLPQGPDASRILADIYLYPVDKKMRANRKIIYFRYMDDIRLFAKNKHDLKLALSEIRLVYDSLFEIYEFAKNNSAAFNERYMNFFISRVIDLMKFKMVKRTVVKDICVDLLSMLENRPHMTSRFCWFFQAAAQYDTTNKVFILKKAVEFLRDKRKNLYEWQELILFDTIRQLLKKGDAKFVRQIRKIKTKHYLTECQKRLILGREGETDDIEQIIDDIKTLPLNDEQKRNAAIAIQGLHRSHKERIYDEHIEKSYTKKFVKSLKGKYYGFTYNLQRDRVEGVADAYPF